MITCCILYKDIRQVSFCIDIGKFSMRDDERDSFEITNSRIL